MLDNEEKNKDLIIVSKGELIKVLDNLHNWKCDECCRIVDCEKCKKDFIENTIKEISY